MIRKDNFLILTLALKTVVKKPYRANIAKALYAVCIFNWFRVSSIRDSRERHRYFED